MCSKSYDVCVNTRNSTVDSLISSVRVFKNVYVVTYVKSILLLAAFKHSSSSSISSQTECFVLVPPQRRRKKEQNLHSLHFSVSVIIICNDICFVLDSLPLSLWPYSLCRCLRGFCFVYWQQRSMCMNVILSVLYYSVLYSRFVFIFDYARERARVLRALTHRYPLVSVSSLFLLLRGRERYFVKYHFAQIQLG